MARGGKALLVGFPKQGWVGETTPMRVGCSLLSPCAQRPVSTIGAEAAMLLHPQELTHQ